MKKIYALMTAAACAICLAGCVKDSLGNENVVPAPDAESFGSILSVTHEGCDIAGNDNPGTRTIVQNTKEVWWKYADGIWVYDSEDDSQVYKYKAVLSEGEMARTANFRIQNHEEPFTLGQGKYYAVYSSMTHADTKTSPPKLYASSDHTIHINLSAYQYHYEGALDYLPSYGVFGNGTSNVRMKPLCGGLRFRLSRGDIKEIVFKSLGGGICGDLTVSNLDSDSPIIENVNNGKGMIIELRTPSYSASAFKADKDYFIVMTPGQMQGFIAELTTTDRSVIRVTSTKTQTIKAGVFGTLAQPLDTYGHVLPQYVDLGLSVPWATFNVGANAPEEYGNYYVWGETTPKDVYSWGTYLWCNGTDHTLTKYNGRNEYGSVVDHVSLLSDTDDVAKAEWKGLWRMPTHAEIRELREKCTWTWTDDYNGTGIKGYEVTGNGNSIFLPAAGLKKDNTLSNAGKNGLYWAGTGATHGTPNTAHNLTFRKGYEDNVVTNRFYGYSVRPVYGEFIPVDSIELNLEHLTIVIGDSCGIDVMYGPKGYSQATSADWISDNPSVATVSSEGVVKGVGIGSANITAYSYNGLSATCQVYVSEETYE